MSSETDTCSSSPHSLFEQEKKREKLHKKLKKKSEKKHKKEKKSHKEKKRSHKKRRKIFSKEHDTQLQKPILSYTKCEENVNENERTDAFGPALPPHFLNINKEVIINEPLAAGPQISEELLENLKFSELRNLQGEPLVNNVSSSSESECEDDKLQDTYGPLPMTNEIGITPKQFELEKRALELKIAAIDGIKPSTSNTNVREEWMLELPDVGLKEGLAGLGNLKRGFHQGKEKPDFSDRSSWTKQPNSSKEKQKPTSFEKNIQLRAQTLYEEQHDAEQEAIARQHTKKHKREESLVEIHQKKLRKEEKKKLKELRKNGAKPERRPFTRDIDLKLSKIDRNQTKQIVDKAKILNTKFSTGHSKYL